MDAKTGRTSKGQDILLPWLIPSALLVSWIVVSATNLIPSYLLPHPVEVIKAGYIYIFKSPGEAPYAGRFVKDLLQSLSRVAGGFSLAVILGIPLGVLSGRLAIARQMMSTFINGLRSVPGICWLPLGMVWLGIGTKTTIFLVALAAFFPIYLNAATGARQLNPLLLQAGAMMGVGKVRGTFSVLLPGIMPHIFSGVRLALGISWAYLVLGELTGVPNGLGALIMDARMLGRIDMIIVGIIIIAAIGRASDLFLAFMLKTLFKSARRMK